MNFNIIESSDISELEKVLMGEGGKLNLLHYSALERFTQNQLSVFCHKHGIYQLPTLELINFIKKEFGSEEALEIGAGNGCIGRFLGIRMADNKMQEIPEIRAYYSAAGQPVIKYGDDVEHLDGIEAIKKYRPKVVVACWVTQKWKPGMTEGNALGVDEEEIFGNGVEKYIHIGNEKTHASKIILDIFPVKKYKHKTILSRSMDRDKNIIYVFTKK
jgi:hypothetical protein